MAAHALCMAVHASITLISQHGLSSHYYCMCYYVISVMHYISNASAIHHSSAGYARHRKSWNFPTRTKSAPVCVNSSAGAFPPAISR
eukprot:jgi/Chrzof1/13978/Cz08g19320.t1